MIYENRERRGASFGAVASEYDEHRPDYPADAIRWALSPVTDEAPEAGGSGSGSSGSGGSRAGASRGGAGGLDGLPVLDLGAGTGKLTAQLAALGASVTAVEPDESMLATLRRQLPGLPAIAGSAESIPLPDSSVRAVLCGQSLHWFDLARALPEIARVLTPGGVLAGLWNNDDDRVEWVAGLHAAAEGAASPAVSVRIRYVTEEMDLGGTASPFAQREIAEFPNSQRRTATSLVAAIATHSRFLIMEPPERDRILARVRRYLGSRPETSAGEFTLPLVTVVLRAVRRS
ncbi:MAG: class I SAM-dependent methyltransferase [Nocardiopsaceae bacterium]|nr:class I SAM-dependent methyltransferase [Nocardiopsaceae bacterium]